MKTSVTIPLNENLYKQFRQKSKETGISMSDAVRLFVERWVSEEIHISKPELVIASKNGEG